MKRMIFEILLFVLSVVGLLGQGGVAAQAAQAAEVGAAAPAFSLMDSSGKKHELAQYKGKYVVLEWLNHGCPFVQKHYGTGNMQALQKEYTGKGVVWLSVISSAPGKQGNMTPAEINKTNREKKGMATAILTDSEGKVGRTYGAKTTPHLYVIDPAGKLIYAGAIDDKPTTEDEDVKTARNYVRAALDQAMAGKPVEVASTKAYGCSVKY